MAFASVPVIAVFTKYDALSSDALGQLRKIVPSLTREDLFKRTPERVEEIFANANIWGRLRETRHPPKDYIRLASKLTHHLYLYGA
jgi:phosphopantothenate synthetase